MTIITQMLLRQQKTYFNSSILFINIKIGSVFPIRIKFIFIFSVLIVGANLSDISYYKILGVTKKATTHEIRQAYKKLAVKLHPDKNSNKDEQERFLKITEAYETLKDPDQRHKYDMYGSHMSYTKKYDFRSQTEYNNLYYDGLYHNDPFVDTVTGDSFFTYLSEGLHFVNFYSPFCPPCQNLVEHWKKLADVYKGIVKIAAVNCKYHNSFCYNSMRIGSYPSLLFYPNGKNGNYFYYRGAHNFEALEQFVMSYVSNKVNVPTLWQLRNVDNPMAYVIDSASIDENALIRIAYRLKGLVSLVIVEERQVRNKLTTNPDALIVFKFKAVNKEIESTDENNIVREIIEALPKLEKIDSDKLKKIRTELRNGARKPWVLYFSSKDSDKLPLYQMSSVFPDMNFGEVDCSARAELCASLQVDAAPAWAVLKRGGAYERAHGPAAAEPRAFLRRAAAARNLHTLSRADLRAALDGHAGTWVVLVVPHGAPWDHILHPFTEASAHFLDDDINFGIMVCTAATQQQCSPLARAAPAALLLNGTRRHALAEEPLDQRTLVEAVELLREGLCAELSEQDALELLHAAGRARSWLVAYLPAGCGAACRRAAHQWRLVARKLRPLDFVRVGILECTHESSGLCRNVRQPTARLYPAAADHHYTVNLQHMSEAPYILEWALEHLDDSVRKLNWQTFASAVFAEELNPSRGNQPWLVYFHSPRCYRCYEMYPDFAIISILLGDSLNFAKVNCVSERSLCQHEHITSYPSIKMYLSNQGRSVSVALQPKEYTDLLQDIRPHLGRYDADVLASVDNLVLSSQRLHFQHDEL